MRQIGNVEFDESHVRIRTDLTPYWPVFCIYAAIIAWALYVAFTEVEGSACLILVLTLIVPAVIVQTGRSVEIDKYEKKITSTQFHIIRSSRDFSEYHPTPILNDESGSYGWYLGRKGDRFGNQLYLQVYTNKPEQPEERFKVFSDEVIPMITEWLSDAQIPKK